MSRSLFKLYIQCCDATPSLTTPIYVTGFPFVGFADDDGR